MSNWIFCILAGLLAVLGAILASGAIDIGMATFGVGLLLFGPLFIFWIMKDHYDGQGRRG